MWWVLCEKLDAGSVSGTLNQGSSDIYWTKMTYQSKFENFAHKFWNSLPPQQKGTEPLLFLPSLTVPTAEVNRIISSKAKKQAIIKIVAIPELFKPNLISSKTGLMNVVLTHFPSVQSRYNMLTWCVCQHLVCWQTVKELEISNTWGSLRQSVLIYLKMWKEATLLASFIHDVFEKNASELKIETINLQTGLQRQLQWMTQCPFLQRVSFNMNVCFGFNYLVDP